MMQATSTHDGSSIETSFNDNAARRQVLERWESQAAAGKAPTRERWMEDLRCLGPVDDDTVARLTRGDRPQWPWIPPFERDQTTELAARVVSMRSVESLLQVAAEAGCPALDPTRHRPSSEDCASISQPVVLPESASVEMGARAEFDQTAIEAVDTVRGSALPVTLPSRPGIYRSQQSAERRRPWLQIAAGLCLALATAWFAKVLVLNGGGFTDRVDPNRAVPSSPGTVVPRDGNPREGLPEVLRSNPSMDRLPTSPPLDDERIVQEWLLSELDRSLEGLIQVLRRVAVSRPDLALEPLLVERVDPLRTLSPAERRQRPEMAQLIMTLGYMRSGGDFAGLAQQASVWRLLSCGWIGGDGPLGDGPDTAIAGCDVPLPAAEIDALTRWLRSLEAP